jgi:AraC-like DNA-binding protein
MRNPSIEAAVGLERSCGSDWVRAGFSRPGFARAEAHFRTMAFAPHRHDSYAIGITLHGVQSFGYRGTTEHSQAGCAFVIHPDEKHDGRAGTDAGYRYRIMYIAPRLIAQALDFRPLPFVNDAVTRETRLHGAICAAPAETDAPLDDLQFDDAITTLADALAAHDLACRKASDPTCGRALRLARDCLDEVGPISSAALEKLTGLSRFTLCRQFRKAFGTSPHRYATMRRLERAKQMMESGQSLAEASTASGFSDQSHMTRQFKQTYGVAPGQWRALARH